MKSEELLDAIGDAKDEYVSDAYHARKGKMPRWAKWTSAIAACLCLVIGGGIYVLNHIVANAGGGGDTDLTYMCYAGPVLPMTIQGDVEGITAQRHVNFDFTPYISVKRSYEDNGETHTYDYSQSESIITDSYILKNETEKDQMLTLLYPFIGDMRNWDFYPTITVNGLTVEMVMHPGPYSGGFEGAWGAKNQQTGSVNIKAIDSFEGYAALLADDSYKNAAFDEFPLLEQSVTVYRLSDYVYSATTEDVNPSLCMEFYVDYAKTTVLSYGMNGGSVNAETGYCARMIGDIVYKPNAREEFQHPDDGYVILVGEDLESYTIQGYRDMGCEDGEELDDLGCTVTRYETTLGEIIRELMADYLRDDFGAEESQTSFQTPTLEMYCGLSAELLTTYGVLGDTPVERYDFGMLEDVFSSVKCDSRIIYLSFDVTIPAGESVTIEATMRKDASVDFVGKDAGKDGYDMATQLGSNLTFTEQTASISGYNAIEIVGQNFGFDLGNGITEVTLDRNELHYWLAVQKVQIG